MIEPHRYYTPTAPELRPIASAQTFARWRCQARGPAYIKSGSRILYAGRDVLDWLQRHRVEVSGSEP